ncbi:MAG: hypothetical protein HZA51_14810 [Planctomycetes bacterium]|nr:hypothetical protein [Planctomycetota bacterium]
MFGRATVVLVTLLLGPMVPMALAQHEHGGEHGKPAEFKMPTTYKAGVEEIQHRLHEISELIESKKLYEVHSEAEVIQKVGNVIGQLALKTDSGVAKSAVKEINKAGRELASRFDAIDKAGDSGDAAGTQKIYDEMVKLAATLEKYMPKVFACPMKCEGDKTYPQPGNCPKCGMVLADVKSHMDHSAKHGGTFFMAPDQKHHLEGTISDTYELRIYFYDEYTKPIPADKFTAEGTLRAGEPALEMAIKLSAEPGKKFLTAKPHRPVKFPVSAKVFIDFKDGKGPQVFDFDFDGPSKPSNDQKADAAHESAGEHKGKGHGHADKP